MFGGFVSQQRRAPAVLRVSKHALAVFSAAVLAVSLHGQSARAANTVELNPAILVMGRYDFESRCRDMVQRVRDRAGGSVAAWVPTIHWQSQGSHRSIVTGYCINQTPTGPCIGVHQGLIDELREGLKRCMRYAADRGYNQHALIPHLDDGRREGAAAWRNAVIFSPLTKYNGWSYEEALLNPLADAIGSVAKPWSQIEFALQGEMSATVMTYPGDWYTLISRVRQRVINAAAAAGVKLPDHQVKIGLSFNFNQVVLGGVSPPSSGGGGGGFSIFRFEGPEDSDDDDDNYNATMTGVGSIANMTGTLGENTTEGFRNRTVPITAAQPGHQQQGQFVQLEGSTGLVSRGRKLLQQSLDVKTLRDLLSSCQFIGISAYDTLGSPNFGLQALQTSGFTFMREFKMATTIDIQRLMSDKGIALHYSEMGLGGGAAMDGSRAAAEPWQAATMPYYGMNGGYYNSKYDPWKQNWEVRKFMINFWQKTLDWLRQGGGPSIRPVRCFMWTMGSYDVLAIYPESTGSEGSYYTMEVADAIVAHNQAATGRK